MLRNTLLAGLAAGIGVFGTGCYGVVTGSNGEEGRLTYSLVTDYETDVDELTELPLLTGYPHSLAVSLTRRGEKDADGAEGQIVHRGDGVESDEAGEGYVPGLTVNVGSPGDHAIESMLDGALFDRIVLQYADPTALELVAWSRAPWADEFTKGAPGRLVVEEGAQLSFLAVPVADGVRLGGEFTPLVTVDAPDLVVADAQVLAVQEGGVTGGVDPVSFYAIEPGTVTFTFEDPVHHVVEQLAVEIIPGS